MLNGWEDGVTKEEFLFAFEDVLDEYDKFILVSLFYRLDLED